MQSNKVSEATERAIRLHNELMQRERLRQRNSIDRRPNKEVQQFVDWLEDNNIVCIPFNFDCRARKSS